MRSLVQDSEPTSRGLQLVVAAACGLVLAWLAVRTSPLLTLAAFLGVAFIIVFLQRPDLGLLTVLLIRSSTDALIGDTGGFAGRLMDPNVGLFVILILAGSLFIISHRTPFLSLPAALPLGFLLIVGVLGIPRAPNVLGAFDRWLAVLSALVVYALVAALFREPKRVQKVIDIILLGFAVPALIGLYQYATGRIPYDYVEQVARVSATFVHPAAFGDYLVIMFSVFLCQTLAQQGIRKRLSVLGLLASGLLLALSLARASLIGALVVFLTVGTVRKSAMLLLAPVLIAIAVLVVPSVGTRFSDPTGGSFADRQGIWSSAYSEWLQRTTNDESSVATVVNRLAGTGPDSIYYLTLPSRGSGYLAHNDYLGVLFEYGVLGLIAFLAMSISLMVTAYRTWRHTVDPPLKAVALSFFAISIGYPVMYFTDNIFSFTENQLYFWALAGLTAAIAQMNGRLHRRQVPASQGAHQQVLV